MAFFSLILCFLLDFYDFILYYIPELIIRRPNKKAVLLPTINSPNPFYGGTAFFLISGKIRKTTRFPQGPFLKFYVLPQT
jgi:hypothetical protein